MVMGDRPAQLRRNRLEVRLAVLITLFFDKPIEASEAISQFGLQALKRASQLFATAFVDMRAPWRFA